jgi:hypothetical protein
MFVVVYKVIVEIKMKYLYTIGHIGVVKVAEIKAKYFFSSLILKFLEDSC